MAKYRRRRIVYRRADAEHGTVEVLECGHVHIMTDSEKQHGHALGAIDGSWSRHCFECVKPEAAP
jgi:hypothetical protein